MFDKISRDSDWLRRIDKPILKAPEKLKKPIEEEQNYDENEAAYYDELEEDENSGKRGVTYEVGFV